MNSQVAIRLDEDDEIIDPDLPICDSHHHLWHRPAHNYLLSDYLADTQSGHNIVSSIFVECGTNWDLAAPASLQSVGETRFAARCAGQAADQGAAAICAGIVSHADLTLGEAVGSVLDQHAEVSNRLRGIRHCAAYDPDPRILSPSHTTLSCDMLASTDFREGFAQLAPRDLVFDMWVYHPQIMDVANLAAAFPDSPIVLDHLGGPLGIGPYKDAREKVKETWRASLALLAENPNVSIKLGGICMPLNGWGLHRREMPIDSRELAGLLRDYVLHAIDVFGVDRSMFESNFPADRPSVRYAVLWNAFKTIVRDFSQDDKNRLFRGTAERIYSLDRSE